MSELIYFLLLFILAREIIYQITLHKLTNKLMSRNYFDYETSGKLGKEKPKENITQSVEESEDFATLDDIRPI